MKINKSNIHTNLFPSPLFPPSPTSSSPASADTTDCECGWRVEWGGVGVYSLGGVDARLSNISSLSTYIIRGESRRWGRRGWECEEGKWNGEKWEKIG